MLRRSFLTGLVSALAAPALVKAASLELVRGIKMLPWIDRPSWCPSGWMPCFGQTVEKSQFPELHAMFARGHVYDAHLGDAFRLPDTRGRAMDWLGSPSVQPQIVKLISTETLVRSNGLSVSPGMLHDFVIQNTP